MLPIHTSDTYIATFTERESETITITFDFFDARKVDFRAPITRVGGCDENSHIHISSKTNDWYTSNGRKDLVVACQQILCRYSRVICFGFSMGAHAAILFGTLFKANRVVAVSPRIQLDPEQEPHDVRNVDFIRKCNFAEGDLRQIADQNIETVIVFDPFSAPDAAHVKIFESHFPVWNYLAFPFSGHNSLQPAKDAKKLRPLMRSLVLGGTSLPFVHKMYKSVRRYSVYYWYNQLLHSRCRTSVVRAAAKFMINHPDTNNPMFFKLGERLIQTGDFETGLPLLRKAYYLTRKPSKNWQPRLIAFEIQYIKLMERRSKVLQVKRNRSKNRVQLDSGTQTTSGLE